MGSSGISEVLVAFAETEGSDRQIWKDCDLGSLQVHANVAAPISKMLGGLVGSEGSRIFRFQAKLNGGTLVGTPVCPPLEQLKH